MRLVTFTRDDPLRPEAGVLHGHAAVLPVSALLGEPFAADVGALLRRGPGVLDALREALARAGPDAGVARADVSLQAPVLQPPTIRDFVAFERHVRNAVKNQGLDEPPAFWYRSPVFYFSNPLTVVGPGATIRMPRATASLDYEIEIGIVIGREGRDVPEAAALDYVAGFALFNDWSARDLCMDEFGGFGLHKGKDFAQGLGPWVTTTDEVAPRLVDGRLDLHVSARVNGETWSDSTTADMHWTLGQLVAHASRDSRIVPGDVLATGTVGYGCVFETPDEHRWLRRGDVVEIDAELLGTLTQTVG
jgi:fumarylacetoacetate (FAA) hydrolase